MLVSEGFKERYRLLGIAWYFFYFGSIFGLWATLIPSVKDLYGVSDTILGLILLGAIGGALFALPVATSANNRFGSGYSSAIAATCLACMLPILSIGGGIWVFAIGVICLGFGMGWMDVSINAQSILYEKHSKQHKLGFFQCLYGLGGLVGALLGGALASSDLSLTLDFVIPSLACLGKT